MSGRRGVGDGGDFAGGGARRDLGPERMAVRWTVRGRVQGVGFRYATLRVARRYGLVGRVRNLVDGRVQIDVAGAPDRVRQLEEWVRQGGPPGARVTELLEEPLAAGAHGGGGGGGGGGSRGVGGAWDSFEIDR